MKRTIERGYINRGAYRGDTYIIYAVRGHYELYIAGNFWSSDDSRREIEEELAWIETIGIGEI